MQHLRQHCYLCHPQAFQFNIYMICGQRAELMYLWLFEKEFCSPAHIVLHQYYWVHSIPQEHKYWRFSSISYIFWFIFCAQGGVLQVTPHCPLLASRHFFFLTCCHPLNQAAPPSQPFSFVLPATSQSGVCLWVPFLLPRLLTDKWCKNMHHLH